MARMDYDKIADRYDAARDLGDRSRVGWHSALRPYFAQVRDPVLDLGAGTGQWTGLLAGWFDAQVIALDLSEQMLRRSNSPLRVQAHVELLPFAESSIGGVWSSAVVHHVADVGRMVAELARVVVSGGAVVLRGVFPDCRAHLDLPLLRLFPEAHEILDTFPRVSHLAELFAAADFRLDGVSGVQELPTESWAQLCKRYSLRADTLLAGISDSAFEAGLLRARSMTPSDADQRTELVMVTFVKR